MQMTALYSPRSITLGNVAQRNKGICVFFFIYKHVTRCHARGSRPSNFNILKSVSTPRRAIIIKVDQFPNRPEKNDAESVDASAPRRRLISAYRIPPRDSAYLIPRNQPVNLTPDICSNLVILPTTWYSNQVGRSEIGTSGGSKGWLGGWIVSRHRSSHPSSMDVRVYAWGYDRCTPGNPRRVISNSY